MTTSVIAARYRRFADEEVRGRSPLYETLVRAAAEDADVLGFLATLPPAKQQPNLLLAAVRHLAGALADWPSFRQYLARPAGRGADRDAGPLHSDQRAGPLRRPATAPRPPEISRWP